MKDRCRQAGQLDEIELAERVGIDQVWFYEHHLNPAAPVPSRNLLIAAAAPLTRRIRFAQIDSMVEQARRDQALIERSSLRMGIRRHRGCI